MWHTDGMRATGSNDVVCRGGVRAAERTLPFRGWPRRGDAGRRHADGGLPGGCWCLLTSPPPARGRRRLGPSRLTRKAAGRTGARAQLRRASASGEPAAADPPSPGPTPTSAPPDSLLEDCVRLPRPPFTGPAGGRLARNERRTVTRPRWRCTPPRPRHVAVRRRRRVHPPARPAVAALPAHSTPVPATPCPTPTGLPRSTAASSPGLSPFSPTCSDEVGPVVVPGVSLVQDLDPAVGAADAGSAGRPR